MNHNDVALIILIASFIAIYWLRQSVLDHLRGLNTEVYHQVSANPLNFFKFTFGRRYKDLDDAVLTQKVTRLLVFFGVFIGGQILVSILR